MKQTVCKIFLESLLYLSDKNDCSRDQKKDLDKCNSAAKSDSFGHYREAKFSQIKLHWTWKLNFIFQKIKSYRVDRVILLEEDHFLTTDALYVAQNIIHPNVEQCRMVGKICLGALGTYTKTKQKVCYPNQPIIILMMKWVPSFYTVVLS